MQGSGFYI